MRRHHTSVSLSLSRGRTVILFPTDHSSGGKSSVYEILGEFQAKILTAVKWAEQMVESMRMLGPAIAINRSEVASTNGVQGGEDCPSHNGPRAPLQMYLRYCTLALSMLSVSVFA